ncbi:MAG: DUF5050 domain-containing protein [Eubacteriales bacterium]
MNKFICVFVCICVFVFVTALALLAFTACGIPGEVPDSSSADIKSNPANNSETQEESPAASEEEADLMYDIFRGGFPIAWSGEWFIYVDGEKCLGRVKADGSERSRLSEDKTNENCLLLQGDTVYYANESDGNKLYSIKTDGTDRIKLCDDELYLTGIMYYSDRIYYRTNTDKHKALYSIKTDKSERIKIEDEIDMVLAFENDVIYYISGAFSSYNSIAVLKRANTDGTDIQQLTNAETEVYGFADGRIIYYEVTDDATYSMKTDGTDKQVVIAERAGYQALFGNYLYFANYGDNGYLYRVKSDGTGKDKLADIKPNNIFVINGEVIFFIRNGETASSNLLNSDGSYKTITENIFEIVLECDDGFFFKTTESDGVKLYFYAFASGTSTDIGYIE